MSTILVIEDNSQSARLAAKLLRQAKHEVWIAEDGETGLDLAIQKSPHLILVDLGLPDMDGQTVLAQLRQLIGVDKVPIIAFTAWPQGTVAEMSVAYGCQGVITKPINTRSFASEINIFLGQSDL